jgi:hypothetical protein
MMRLGFAVVWVCLAGLSVPAAAQRPGLPVHHAPAHLPVRGGYLDFGRGSRHAGTGALTVYGIRLLNTFEKLQVSAGAAHVSPDADALDDGLTVHGAVALQLQEARPTRTANVQLGVGWTSIDIDQGGTLRIIDVPISLGIGFYAPAPVGTAEAWAAPRIHVRHTSTSGTSGSDTRVGPGLSLGLNFTHADTQLGFDLAGEILALKEPRGDWRGLLAFSISLHLLLAH